MNIKFRKIEQSCTLETVCEEFNKYIDKKIDIIRYNDDFYGNHVVIVVFLSLNAGGYNVCVDLVENYDDGIHVYISINSRKDQMLSMTMVSGLFLIEIERTSDIEGKPSVLHVEYVVHD